VGLKEELAWLRCTALSTLRSVTLFSSAIDSMLVTEKAKTIEPTYQT
jgi:hypothetical protein